VIAWLWLRHKPSPSQRIALLLVFIGIALTAADTLLHGAHLTGMQMLGDLLFLCGSVLWAVFTLLLRRYPVPPLTAAVSTTLGSAILYLPVWWFFLPSTLGQAPVAEIAIQAGYQGILVVFVAMLLYTYAVRSLGAQTVTLLMAIVPGLAAVAAVPVLGEPLSMFTLAGLAAVTMGALLAARLVSVPSHAPAHDERGVAAAILESSRALGRRIGQNRRRRA